MSKPGCPWSSWDKHSAGSSWNEGRFPRHAKSRSPSRAVAGATCACGAYEATLGMRRIRRDKNAGPYARGPFAVVSLCRARNSRSSSARSRACARIFRHERDRVWVVVTPSAAQMRDAQGSGENAVRESVDMALIRGWKATSISLTALATSSASASSPSAPSTSGNSLLTTIA